MIAPAPEFHRGQLYWLKNEKRRSRAVVISTTFDARFVRVIRVKTAKKGRTGGVITGQLHRGRRAEWVKAEQLEALG